MIRNSGSKEPTDFDIYLEDRLKDPLFAERFRRAGEAWDVALQLAALRKDAGLSQAELAKRVGTSQQQISRLESANYEGHSLSMLRRVADALGAAVSVQIYRQSAEKQGAVAEPRSKYRAKSAVRRKPE